MFPVLERGEAGIFFKFPEKVTEIVKSAIQTDVHDRKVCGLQKDDSLFDTVLINIRNRRFSKGFFEKTAEILFVHIGLPGKIPYVQFILVMRTDIGQGRFNDFNTVIICFDRLSE